MVLGSGGVARDYLNLTQKAMRIANERDTNPTRPHNRIGAEDVNEAAADMSAQKQEDLRRDASTEADKLRERLADVVKFSLDVNRTNVLLVEGPKLQKIRRSARWQTFDSSMSLGTSRRSAAPTAVGDSWDLRST